MMAEPIVPPRAKLFIGILAPDDGVADRCEILLIKKYGEIDFKTRKISFDHTDYYRSIGPRLFRILVSFKKLVKREGIVDIKLACNRLERKISGKGARLINIDPGYLTLSNVYLATCKEFFHRVYLNKGIYLENEYRYVAKHYEPWEWTYPDYRKHEYIDFFHNVRKIYTRQLK